MDIKLFNPTPIAMVPVEDNLFRQIDRLSLELFKFSSTKGDYPNSDLTLRGGEQRRVYPSRFDVSWLVEWIESNAKEYYEKSYSKTDVNLKLENCWTITQLENSYQVAHIHSSGTVSGNLYLELPELNHNSADTDCCISFQFQQSLNPEHAKFIHVKPKIGTMLIFPSHVPHQVYPWQGKGSRRVLAWDCRLV